MKNVLLINYDNGSRWPVLPQNLYHLQACLSQAGIPCRIEDFNLTKKPYETLYQFDADIIGLGFISGYWQHQEAIKIAKVIKEHPRRDKIKFIIGGHAPSAAPLYYQEKLDADAVFVGAADVSLLNWVNTGCCLFNDPDGFIVASAGWNTDISQYYFNGVSNGIKKEVYKRIKFPNTKDHEFAIQILSGRGCPYNCAFCFRPDEGFKAIHLTNLIADIQKYALVDGIRHFQFSDELLMSTKRRTTDICLALAALQERIGIDLAFDCNGRLNIATKHPALLKQMKEVGFRYLNYGCESMSQEVLDNINKRQTVDEIKGGIANTLQADLSPGINFMFGNPGDDEKSLQQAVDFIIEHNDGSELRTIRPVTPYPGTELYRRLRDESRCHGVEDFYRRHVNSDLFSFHFMPMSNEAANDLLYKANVQLLNDWAKEKTLINKASAFALYHGVGDPKEFRGFREV